MKHAFLEATRKHRLSTPSAGATTLAYSEPPDNCFVRAMGSGGARIRCNLTGSQSRIRLPTDTCGGSAHSLACDLYGGNGTKDLQVRVRDHSPPSRTACVFSTSLAASVFCD